MAAAPKNAMGMMEYYFVTKAPFQLPPNVKESLVKFGPWIDLVLLVILMPVVLLALGLSAVILPFSGLAGAPAAAGLGLASIALLAQAALMAIALPGLFARKRSGWNFVFYGAVLNLVYSFVNFNIFSGVINALISFYFLFQIRSYYK